MTLPNNFNFSTPEELNPENLYRNLNEMYEKISTGVNGISKSSSLPSPFTYKPTLIGSSSSGTFTYSRQYANVLRIGQIVDFWYDIQWSSQSGASGALNLVLPYKPIIFTGSPFVGSAIPNALAYGSANGIYLEIESSSFNAYIKTIPTTGNSISNLNVVSSGGFRGFVRYLTQESGGP